MPKGDKEILKADTDDGYTQIANLLLEATAAANFSGIKIAVILVLWRYTYGWTNGNKQRRTEVEISLEGLARCLNIHSGYACRVLSALKEDKVINRKDMGQGKGYVYSMNTRVNEWCKGKLIGLGLTERFKQPLTKKYRVPPTKKLTLLATKLATPKKNIKKIKENSELDNTGNKFKRGKYGHMVSQSKADTAKVKAIRRERNADLGIENEKEVPANG